MSHTSVLLNEVIDGLEIEPNDVVVDATINGGGHSFEIAKLLGEKGILMGIDMDSGALKNAKDKLKRSKCKTIFKEGNYRELDKFLNEEGIARVDKFLFDLGLSSGQLDLSKRGFSFMREEPLLMTFKENPNEGDLTAEEIVNTWDEENLADIIYGYGEESFAKKIAKKIVLERTIKKIVTTKDLVEVIEKAVPLWYQKKRKHFATKTFQALRITVNDEIQGIKDALDKSINYLSPNGKIAIISFHSIEDRIVKHTFKNWKKEGLGKNLAKKPITPSDFEIKENPRSRSSKLRIFEKTNEKKS